MDDVRHGGAGLQGDPAEGENAKALRLRLPAIDGTVRNRPLLGVSVGHRLRVLAALVLVIGLGLASRKYDGVFPRVLGKYPGDALWTVAAYLGWKLLVPTMAPRKLGLAAMGLSFLVEFLQLYHAPWLDALRGNRLGHLFLGSTFNPMDLVAYTVGGCAAVWLDSRMARPARGRLPNRRGDQGEQG
jgi:hypothetical protein